MEAETVLKERECNDLGAFKDVSRDVMYFHILSQLEFKDLMAFSLLNHRAHALMNYRCVASNELEKYFPLEYAYLVETKQQGKIDLLLLRKCWEDFYQSFSDEQKAFVHAIKTDNVSELENILLMKDRLTAKDKLEMLCPFVEFKQGGMPIHITQVVFSSGNLMRWAYKWKSEKIVAYFKELVEEAYKDIQKHSAQYFYHKIITAETKEDIIDLQAMGLDLGVLSTKAANGEDATLRPVHFLAQFDRDDLIDIFIELGVSISVDLSGNHKKDILTTACEFGSINVVRRLIKLNEENYNIYRLDSIPKWRLASIACNSHPLILREVFSVSNDMQKVFYTSLSRKIGHTLSKKNITLSPDQIYELSCVDLLSKYAMEIGLRIAARNNLAASVRKWIEVGADINTTVERLNDLRQLHGILVYYYPTLDTPLIKASKAGHTKIVKILIDASVDRNHKNDRKKTAFDVAGNQEIKCILNSLGRDLIEKIRDRLNELEGGKGDKLVSDVSVHDSNQVCDMIARVNVYLNNNELTLLQWVKGFFTHPINTIRFHQNWKKAKAQLKEVKHAWLYEQQRQVADENDIANVEPEPASKKMAKRFTTNYMMTKMHKSKMEVKADAKATVQYKTIQNNIRSTFTAKLSDKTKVARKVEKAHIWKHAHGLFIKNGTHKLGAFAKAKAELLEAEVKEYNKV